MTTQAEWLRMTDPAVPWRQRYATLEGEVRTVLATLAPDETLTTRRLVQRLFPDPRGPEGATVVRRLYNAMEPLATHGLADCVTLGKPTVIYGRLKQRRLWKHPAGPTLEDVRRICAAYLDARPAMPDDLRYRAAAALLAGRDQEENQTS